MSILTISTLPALTGCGTWPETGSEKHPISALFRLFPGKDDIQAALAYPSDQFLPESRKSRFWAHVPKCPVFGRNRQEPVSGSSLITVWSRSAFGREKAVFRVPPVPQKVQKYSPFCLVPDPEKPGSGYRILDKCLGDTAKHRSEPRKDVFSGIFDGKHSYGAQRKWAV